MPKELPALRIDTLPDRLMLGYRLRRGCHLTNIKTRYDAKNKPRC
jgi:hypothetical protein